MRFILAAWLLHVLNVPVTVFAAARATAISRAISDAARDEQAKISTRTRTLTGGPVKYPSTIDNTSVGTRSGNVVIFNV